MGSFIYKELYRKELLSAKGLGERRGDTLELVAIDNLMEHGRQFSRINIIATDGHLVLVFVRGACDDRRPALRLLTVVP